MDQIKTGKFIALLRKQHGLTQEALGEKLGITNKTVSRWENANYMPDIEMLQLLSKELNVSVNELLAGEFLSDEEFRKKADENVIFVSKASAFSFDERQTYFKKKWRKDHISLFVLLGLLLIAAAVLPFVFDRPWFVGLAPLLALAEYGVQNNRMMVAMTNVLGGVGVTGIGPNEVYSAITQGTIDGAENNWPTYQNMGDYEAAPYYVLDKHTMVPEILLASEAVLADLDEADVEIIKACAKETQEFEKQKWAEKEASSEQIVRAAGCTITELTPEAFAEFQDAMTRPVTGMEGIDDGKSLYEMYGGAYQDVIDAITAVGEGF